MKRIHTLSLAASAALVLCFTLAASPLAMARESQVVPTMVSTAQAFLAVLTPEQTQKTVYTFDSDERMNWHYVPMGDRKGLPLREMTKEQKLLAHGLLAAGLSQTGYIKATEIMSLDEVLRQLRLIGQDPPEKMPDGWTIVRDPEHYTFTIFGEPSETGVWGYRVEGHHVSLNFTIVNGKVVGSPDFFGANPAKVLSGPRKGFRVLKQEEDLPYELVNALTPTQKKSAQISEKARGFVTGNKRKAELEGPPTGLKASDMTKQQRDLLQVLVEVYADNLPPELAQERMAKLKRAGTNVYFAWAGSFEKGQGHYYRIQAPEFLIEYDQTQNNANHIHSVWRDFNGDWGLDLLGEHYKNSHDHDQNQPPSRRRCSAKQVPLSFAVPFSGQTR